MFDNQIGVFAIIWVVSVALVLLIDQAKNRKPGMSGIVLALILGPVAVLLALLEPRDQ